MSDLAFIMLLFLGSYFVASAIAALFPAQVSRFSEWVFGRIFGDRG